MRRRNNHHHRHQQGARNENLPPAPRPWYQGWIPSCSVIAVLILILCLILSIALAVFGLIYCYNHWQTKYDDLQVKYQHQINKIQKDLDAKKIKLVETKTKLGVCESDRESMNVRIDELHRQHNHYIGSLYREHSNDIKKLQKEYFDQMTKLNDQCNSTSLKEELAKLKGRTEEQEKTAMSKALEHEGIVKAKESKLDQLIEKYAKLNGGFEKCKGNHERLEENLATCRGELDKCKEELSRKWF